MANEEHLAVLRQGVAAWNAWRKNNPDIPDLSDADLLGTDLLGTDLGETVFAHVDLSATMGLETCTQKHRASSTTAPYSNQAVDFPARLWPARPAD
jgi:uncharacterized protein YjbI with pentapeptide repeats